MYISKAKREAISSAVLSNRVNTRESITATDFETRLKHDTAADVAKFAIDIMLGLDNDGHAKRMLADYLAMGEEAAIRWTHVIERV